MQPGSCYLVSRVNWIGRNFSGCEQCFHVCAAPGLHQIPAMDVQLVAVAVKHFG